MSKLGQLIKGEIIRLVKYKIIVFGVLASLIWVVIIALSDVETTLTLVPFLVLMDAGLMSTILLGASFFYEKQEGTMQTILVSPVSMWAILLAKIVTMVLMATISFILVVCAALIFHDFPVDVVRLFLSSIIVVISHTAIGFVLTLTARDYMQLLIRTMGMMLVFFLPVLLIALEIIPQSFEFILFISPAYSGQLLFESALHDVETWKMILSCGYLIAIPSLLYPLYISRRYRAVAMEG